MTTSPLSIGDASALGFDADRLALIGPAMEEYVADKRVPNLVTLVARRGQSFISNPVAYSTLTLTNRPVKKPCSGCFRTPNLLPVSPRSS